MLYRNPKHIQPSNANYADHVRRMNRPYEASAQQKTDLSIESAGYEITLYQQLKVGRPCTCSLYRHNDILDMDGNLTTETMQELMRTTATSTIRDKRVIGAKDYRDTKQEKDIYSLDELTFERLEQERTKVKEETFGEDLEEGEGFHDIYGNLPVSAFASNCPVCARTGVVGGFDVFGGRRIVVAPPAFTSLFNCEMDVTASPFIIRQLSEDQQAVAEFEVLLPKNPFSLETIRLLNEFEELQYVLYVFNDLTSQFDKLLTPRDILNYCNGKKRRLMIKTSSSFTHLEIQFKLRQKPLFVDISNFNKALSNKSLNDLEQISVNLPSYVGELNRGDVFYSKQMNALWVVIAVEMITTANNGFGFTIMADRVKASYEPYSVFNPYYRDRREMISR